MHYMALCMLSVTRLVHPFGTNSVMHHTLLQVRRQSMLLRHRLQRLQVQCTLGLHGVQWRVSGGRGGVCFVLYSGG